MASSEIEVTHARPESPHNAALYEAGKALLVDSVTAGRDFCRFMIGVSTGAIPVYMVLIGLIVGKEYRPKLGDGIVLLAAPSVFLVAAAVFAVGVFPFGQSLSLDLPEEIERVRVRLLSRRRQVAILGFIAFAVGTAFALAGITYALADELGRAAPVVKRG